MKKAKTARDIRPCTSKPCKTSIIPNDSTVTVIGEDSVVDCGMISIEIPHSITHIKKHAFSEAYALTSIYYDGTKSEWNQIVKEEFWDADRYRYVIICSDGNIFKYDESCTDVVAVRSVSLQDAYTANYIYELWMAGEVTEDSLVELMNEYCSDQGGGMLHIIGKDELISEVDTWCFANERKPGDCAIIENDYGYTICYISNITE